MLEGGNVLHKVKCQQGVLYSEVAEQYANFVKKHYGTNATVVFNGYCNGHATKDHEHQRRAAASDPCIIFDHN